MDVPMVQTQRRKEDARLVSGSGRYTGDLRPDGVLHLAFLRSPHAHARIVRIDVAEAAGMDGVVAVLTAADLEAAGLKPIPGGFTAPRPDGSPAPSVGRPALARDRVRHVGEPVVAVVAETLAQAITATEFVEVDYDAEAVATFEEVAGGDSPAVHDAAPDNVAFEWTGGDAAATDAAMRSAAHVTRLPLSISRVAISPMEPRGILTVPEAEGRLIVHASHQSPFTLRDGLAAVGFPKEALSVRIGDVGGSFGLKMGVAPEDVVVVQAARALGRPVRWDSTRSEAFVSDDQARRMDAFGEIGFDADGRIVGLRVRVIADLGAYLSGKSGWAIANIGGIAGVYDIPAIHATVRGVFTHTCQTAAYRGAGRPEATYVIERLMDVAARELGLSPIELRRRNLIPASAMPYRTALVFHYDSGDFAGTMDKACRLADVAGFETRRVEAAARGRLRGLGIANCIEVAGGPFRILAPDAARASLLPDGTLSIETGTMSVGQGHETVFSQILADRFGVPVDRVSYRQGDTDALPVGRGNGGSSGLSTGGSAVTEAATGLVAALSAIAADQLGVSPESVSLADGIFRSRDGNATRTLAEIAGSLPVGDDGAVARHQATFKPPEVTYPNGTHICEVEIDPETGLVSIERYSAVEDIGRVLHPLLAEGQIQGGVAQGIGQALGEIVVHDESGQVLTGSYMDYQMPRAGDLPAFHLAFNEVPTARNPLGAKGVGEAGTVGSLSATMNAVNDALARHGVPAFDMPATPGRVWEAIAKSGGA